ncbi:MAG TPA: hypothetical protein VLL08_03775 [Kineosporiaceae bacterium]|nr:hypothetical protein [Kineosporiaceae bacterium]
MPEIVQLLVSPIHRFEGRPADGPLPAPPGELVEMIQIREGLGVVGDRYFGKPAHREASISVGAGAPPPASALARLLVIAQESLPPRADLTQVRRNILVSGIDVDALIGSVLTLDSGTGPVRLHLRRPANPCAWIDTVVGPEPEKHCSTRVVLAACRSMTACCDWARCWRRSPAVLPELPAG